MGNLEFEQFILSILQMECKKRDYKRLCQTC